MKNIEKNNWWYWFIWFHEFFWPRLFKICWPTVCVDQRTEFVYINLFTFYRIDNPKVAILSNMNAPGNIRNFELTLKAEDKLDSILKSFQVFWNNSSNHIFFLILEISDSKFKKKLPKKAKILFDLIWRVFLKYPTFIFQTSDSKPESVEHLISILKDVIKSESVCCTVQAKKPVKWNESISRMFLDIFHFWE